MKIKQVYNILKVSLIAVVVLFLFELLFTFDAITDAISNLIINTPDVVVYLVIWLIMIIQVTLIPIPVYVIVNACVVIPSIDLSITTSKGWLLIFIIMSAYMIGAILAYLVGYKFGSKAVKWCAGTEEDYNKWVNVFNSKGKWYYAITVLLPVFPDDLLCFVAGGVKLKFWFYILANFVGRFIGLIAMILSLELLHMGVGGNGFPVALLAWGIILIAIIISLLVIKTKLKQIKDK